MTIAKTLLVATFSSFSLLACVAGDDELADDGDWQAQGNEINDITCERIYECFEGADLSFLQSLSPDVGQSAAECQDHMRRQNEDATQPADRSTSKNIEASSRLRVADTELEDAKLDDLARRIDAHISYIRRRRW